MAGVTDEDAPQFKSRLRSKLLVGVESYRTLECVSLRPNLWRRKEDPLEFRFLQGLLKPWLRNYVHNDTLRRTDRRNKPLSYDKRY